MSQTQSEQIENIHRYMSTTRAKFSAEQHFIFDLWDQWFRALKWHDRSFDASILERAKNYRAKVQVTLTQPKKMEQHEESTFSGDAMPTIKQGSTGDAVRQWQGIIGVTVDGQFGPNTATATKTWQSSHGLTADGIVGPASWGAASLPPGYSATADNPVNAAIDAVGSFFNILSGSSAPAPTPTPAPPKPVAAPVKAGQPVASPVVASTGILSPVTKTWNGFPLLGKIAIIGGVAVGGALALEHHGVIKLPKMPGI
jgi:hypothetical protein